MNAPAAAPDAARTLPLARWALALALGGLLGYVGIAKLADPQGFAMELAGYRLLPAQANQTLAVILPWLELLCGAALVLGLWVRAAAMVSGALMLIFAAAVVTALARGLDISCGCFGTAHAARIGLQTLALQVGCLAAAWGVWRLAGREESANSGTALPA